MLLGLLANTMVFGTILSLVFGGTLALQRTADRRSKVTGIAIYLAFLVLAVATVMRPPDAFFPDTHLGLDLLRLPTLLSYPFGAILPFSPKRLLLFLLDPGSTTGLHFWNSNPFDVFVRIGLFSLWPVSLVFLFAPILGVCWFATRDVKATSEFAVVFLGIVLFAFLLDLSPQQRYVGAVFLMLVAAVWRARTRNPGPPSRIWIALLILNAVGGLASLRSEVRPLFQSHSAATWVREHAPSDALLIGTPDWAALPVAAYLGRPLYALDCTCEINFVRWDNKRAAHLDSTEISQRLGQTVRAAGNRPMLVILNRRWIDAGQPVPSIDPERELSPLIVPAVPGVTMTLATSFTDAARNVDDYFIYRVDKAPP
jgi:hypothetical protein